MAPTLVLERMNLDCFRRAYVVGIVSVLSRPPNHPTFLFIVGSKSDRSLDLQNMILGHTIGGISFMIRGAPLIM